MTNHPNRNKKVTIELTRKELFLLCLGLSAGVGDDGIQNLGLTKREMAMLGAVGNRLEILRGAQPSYYDKPTDY